MMLLLLHVRGLPSALKAVLRLTPVTGAPVQPMTFEVVKPKRKDKADW